MRKNTGREAWQALQEWEIGQAAAERLGAQVVLAEGFKSVDPSHPLGGPDGLKDILCRRKDIIYVVAAYFPRGQKTPTEIKTKFQADYAGVLKNGATGFVFVTNQELTLSMREVLASLCKNTDYIEIYHLERIAAILNSPPCYGLRLEFLEIEMTKEEQLSFIALRDKQLKDLVNEQKLLVRKVDEIISGLKDPNNSEFAVLEKLKEFRDILNQISGESRINYGFYGSGHVNKLSVPLADIVEFKRILDAITGNSYSTLFTTGTISSLKVPLAELREFGDILTRVTTPEALGASTALSLLSGSTNYGKISALKVPLDELKEYERILGIVIQKLKEKRQLED